MAWVANRSTRVRKAVTQITAERSNTPEERSGISIRAISKVDTACVTAGSSILRRHCDARLCGRTKLGLQASFVRRRPSHVLVVLVVQHIAHEQDDGLVSEVLPPM